MKCIILLYTSRNGYNNNDYKMHLYEQKQIGYNIHF